MTLLEQETLPAAIAGLLTDEQRQAMIEAPREKRLEALAAALGRPEAEVLAKLAAAARLDVASNLETDPDARGVLPARLVHEYQIIPIKYAGDRGREKGAGTENGAAAAESSARLTPSSAPFPPPDSTAASRDGLAAG